MNDVVYPYNGILLSNKKQHTVVINLEIIVLNERSQTKIVHTIININDSIHINF